MTLRNKVQGFERIAKVRRQRIGLIETKLATKIRERADLASARTSLVAQIDQSAGHQQAIMDLMLRHLDRLMRKDAELSTEVSRLTSDLMDEQRKFEATDRALDASARLLERENERRSLQEVIERIAANRKSSLR